MYVTVHHLVSLVYRSFFVFGLRNYFSFFQDIRFSRGSGLDQTINHGWGRGHVNRESDGLFRVGHGIGRRVGRGSCRRDVKSEWIRGLRGLSWRFYMFLVLLVQCLLTSSLRGRWLGVSCHMLLPAPWHFPGLFSLFIHLKSLSIPSIVPSTSICGLVFFC